MGNRPGQYRVIERDEPPSSRRMLAGDEVPSSRRMLAGNEVPSSGRIKKPEVGACPSRAPSARVSLWLIDWEIGNYQLEADDRKLSPEVRRDALIAIKALNRLKQKLV